MARLSDVFLKRDRVKDATAKMKIEGTDVVFIVRPAMNPDYVNAVQNPPKEMENVDGYYADCVAIHLLVGWENVCDDDGNFIEPTQSNKIDVLKKYTEIATRILNYSANPRNFIGSNFEEELGN